VNPAVPADLERICLKALDAQPGNRYASVEALAAELRRWRLQRQSPRGRRGLLVGVLVLAVAAALGLGSLVWHPWRTPTPPLKVEEVILRFWSRDGVKKGWRLGLVRGAREIEPGALPARNDELFRTEVRLNQAGYVYLVMLNADGSFLPLYPWNQDVEHLDPKLGEPPTLQPCAELIWPAEETGRGVDLGPPGGLETVLVLVREQPWPAGLSLLDVLGTTRITPTPDVNPLEMRIRGGDPGEAFTAVQIDAHRSAKLKLGEIDDPLDQLLGRLRKHAGAVRALGFAHADR
jgi:hypothetical protein